MLEGLEYSPWLVSMRQGVIGSMGWQAEAYAYPRGAYGVWTWDVSDAESAKYRLTYSRFEAEKYIRNQGEKHASQ